MRRNEQVVNMLSDRHGHFSDHDDLFYLFYFFILYNKSLWYNQLPSTLVIKQGSIKRQIGLWLTISSPNEWKWLLHREAIVQKYDSDWVGVAYHIQYFTADFLCSQWKVKFLLCFP